MRKILLTMCLFATVSVSAQRVFTANANGDWNDSAIWTITDPDTNGGTNTVPSSVDQVNIPGHQVNVTTAASAKSILVGNGTSSTQLFVRSGGALTVEEDVLLTRSLNSFRLVAGSNTAVQDLGTLIVKGAVRNNTNTSDRRFRIDYRLENNVFYLLSSFATSNPRLVWMTTGTEFDTNATSRAFAVYKNENVAGSKYDYLTNGTIANNSSTDNINGVVPKDGVGLSVSVDSGNSNKGKVVWEGFYNRAATSSTPIDMDVTTGDAFNLVGNAYLANIYGNTSANATNILSQNSGILAEQTLWFWNSATSMFVVKNQSSPAFTIPPLTGFFVKSAPAGGNFTYTKAMETHTSAGDVFSKSINNRFEIDLSIETGELKRTSSIRYIDNTTTSFDNGYDSSIFGGYASELELYTGLADGSSDKRLAIQSLPNENFQDMIVPVGITAAANSEITFTAAVSNLPKGHKVYLEDRLEGTVTSLDDMNDKYTVTIKESSTDGRFFLHTRTSAVLNLDTELLSSISIYKTNNSNLRIAGLTQGKSNVTLYNVLGKEIMSSSFIANGVQDITLPKLAKGVYIVQLETEAGNLNKKIILE